MNKLVIFNYLIITSMLILQFSVLPQTFGAEFTDRYLKNRLDEPVDVHVSRMSSKKPRIVRMKMGAGSKNAILTTGWDKVVRRFKLNQDDIALFCFHERDDGELHLLVEALPGQ